jgi:hypothetical protein
MPNGSAGQFFVCGNKKPRTGRGLKIQQVDFGN